LRHSSGFGRAWEKQVSNPNFQRWHIPCAGNTTEETEWYIKNPGAGYKQLCAAVWITAIFSKPKDA
jgi:hypothetical protein